MNLDFSFIQKIKILFQKISNRHTLYKYHRHIIWLLVVFLVYACVYVPPMWWAGFGFVTWVIPIIIFGNLFYFCVYTYHFFFIKNQIKNTPPNNRRIPRKIYLIWFYFWLCLVSLPFWDATLGGWKGWRNDFFVGNKTNLIGKTEKNSEKIEQANNKITAKFPTSKYATTSQTFEVISYNVRVFNAYEHLRNQNPKASAQMLNWLAEHPAEIKCLQEFYHLESSKEFHTIDILTKTQKPKYQYFVRSERALRDKHGFFGTIILTKYPILRGGNVFEGRLPHQTPIFADVLLPNKDTMRVINAHLQSMNIDDKDNRNTIFQKIWKGFSPRTNQIHLLADFIKKSPYPILLCTDLNDLPYSYAYYRLSNSLQNAFEMRGSGFGATFNSIIPIVRIDHQFFDEKKLACQKFSVIDTLDCSDHFPILGKFLIKK